MLSKDLCHQLDKNTKPEKTNQCQFNSQFSRVHLGTKIDIENYLKAGTLS